MTHKCPVCGVSFRTYHGTVLGVVVHKVLEDGLKHHLEKEHPDYDMSVHHPEYMAGFTDHIINEPEKE